jgi:hypothetical protein
MIPSATRRPGIRARAGVRGARLRRRAVWRSGVAKIEKLPRSFRVTDGRRFRPGDTRGSRT